MDFIVFANFVPCDVKIEIRTHTRLKIIELNNTVTMRVACGLNIDHGHKPLGLIPGLTTRATIFRVTACGNKCLL